METRIEYFERMLADNRTGLLTLANEYNKIERHEDEAAVLGRYVATHECELTDRQHFSTIRFSALLTGGDVPAVTLVRA